MDNKKYVITIARQFGSMGRPIAMKLSEILGVEFYDRDIVDQAAKKLNLPVSIVDENEESAKEVFRNTYSRMQFPLGRQKSTEVQDNIFEAQKNIINFLAEKESCIIVGRCGDFILSEMDNVIHIFIYAPYEERLKHCTNELGLSTEEGKRMIKKVDEAREAYHLQYAGFKPDDYKYKDIMIDSSLLGVDGTAEYLAALIKKKFCL
ncbi:MAG: cytidylate kinase-like family protein [Clostridiales bacterium]|jgi:cytidylate kinase|nr:cytidylate kinase-like family protein [Clostridiales bacterium]